MTAGRPTPTDPPYRLVRASRHLQDTIIALEHHRAGFDDPDDMDLSRALDHLLQAKQIIAVRLHRARV